jgi:Amino acid permease
MATTSEAQPRTSGESQDGFARILTWRGGFVLALVIPMSGLTLVGYEIGAIGALGALAVWVGTSVIALLQNFIYTELAGMFPHKSGGIALYASEIWSEHCVPLGGVFGWGYWAGWSLTLAVVSLVIGDLVQAQWFPHVTGTISILGNHVGLPTYIAAAVVIAVYLINIAGLKPVVNTNLVIGAALVLLAAVCILGPVILGQLHFPLSFNAGHGTWTVIVTLVTWSFVACWTAYGTEIAATFAPEYGDPHRDVARALRSSALVMIVVVALSTTIFPAAVGEHTRQQPGRVLRHARLPGAGQRLRRGGDRDRVRGAADRAGLGHERLRAGAVRDGRRPADRPSAAQAQPARAAGPRHDRGPGVQPAGPVPGQQRRRHHLRQQPRLPDLRGVRARGFLLMRRTRPDATRPIRLGPIWIPIAALLLAFNVFMIVVGFTHPGLVGYGGGTEQLISLSVIAVGLISYFFARVVQEGQRGRILWRVRTAATEMPATSGAAE